MLFLQQVPGSAWRMVRENNSFKQLIYHKYGIFMSKLSACGGVSDTRANKDALITEIDSDQKDLQWQLVSIQVSFITVAAFGGMMPVLAVVAMPGLVLQYLAFHWIRRTQKLEVGETVRTLHTNMTEL